MTIPEMRIWRKKLRGVLVSSNGSQQQRRRRRRSAVSQSENEQLNSSRFDTDESLSGHDLNSPITASDWVITIREKLDQVPPSVGNCWLNYSIFGVPRNLREIEPKAYIPQIVSIGPYHRGKARLKEMERHKWRLLRHVLERTGRQVELYLEAMAELEEKARTCYAKPMKHIKTHEFVEMMLLDACFILELLNSSVKGFIYSGYSWGDPIFTSRGILPCIQRDMLMLENQLPLFVIDRLFALTCDPYETDTVSQLTLQFFNSVIPGCQNLLHQETNFAESGLHLLHVIRQSMLPSSKATFSRIPFKPEKKVQSQLMVHCVTKLRDSGVGFRKKNSEKFMDIEFKNGVLHIPPLVIHDSTKSIFLNLMIFEQCYPHCSNHVTSYITFMDGLINSPHDVGYLRYQGIIDHGLGSEEEVADLFNNLCKEIAFDINDCYLSGVSDAVNRYFDRKWHTWKASLKQQYFSNPWAIISLLAAIFLIGLTLAQTFYTIFAYYIPPS